jgi:hypothetical protein
VFINKSKFEEKFPGTDKNEDCVIGEITIEGRFSVFEWERIKIMFIALGLAQIGDTVLKVSSAQLKLLKYDPSEE